MKYIDFLVKHTAQPIADRVHNRFGVTCYRLGAWFLLASYCPGLARLVWSVAGHSFLHTDSLIWTVIGLATGIGMYTIFIVADEQVKFEGYDAIPYVNFLARFVIYFAILVWLFGIGVMWADKYSLSTIIVQISLSLYTFAWLLALCVVRPRARSKQKQPSHAVFQGI